MKKMNKTPKNPLTNKALQKRLKTQGKLIRILQERLEWGFERMGELEAQYWNNKSKNQRFKNIFSQKNMATASLVILTITCLYQTLKPFF